SRLSALLPAGGRGAGGARPPPPPRARPARRTDADLRRDLATARPLVPTATLGGAVAAGGPLLVCLAVAVVGWFLTDAGAVGSPSGALGVGAHGWLAAHGSTVAVEGIRITAMPLGLTLVCAWVAWRLGHRVGESVSGHGPDADRIADGERDWTVATATAFFAVGYAVVGVVAGSVAATAASSPSTARVVLWSVLVAVGVGGPAIARGSGRAAVWLPRLPARVRDTALVARRILVAWALVSVAVLAAAFVADFSTAANVASQLHADAGAVVLLLLLTALVLPNATLFSSSYLLGPGFAVGTGTVVSTSAVVLGPLPMFPLLAALPDQGPTPGWAGWLMLLPVLVAVVVAGRVQRDRPVLAWDQAAIRGCAGGITAGVVLGLLTALAGGAVGPGRMAEVGPFTVDVLLHAITSFGIGGVTGALSVCWWQREGEARVRSRLRALRPRPRG
ncbi:cell division protein PerM, partial [Nocardioides sp. SYSU DS0651]|uniref:cell division protein PerM n=1 Tax=Nocardioides sp. SYSU DS0651 TaxID=3415955 RepID=UPI003F4BC4C1